MTKRNALLLIKERNLVDSIVRVLQENMKYQKANRIVCQQIQAEKILYKYQKELSEEWEGR